MSSGERLETKADKVALFVANVESSSGEQSKKKVRAATRSQARMLLSAEGLTVLNVQPVPAWHEIEIGGKVPDGPLLKFSRQMSAFTSAGISISSALALLGRTTKNKPLKKALVSILEDIENGDSLASAVSAQSARFPAYYPAILDASERTGDVSTALQTLADYVERDLTSKRAVRSALYYPIVLVVLGIVAILVLSLVVLPRFQVFFASLNAELPATTRALMNFSTFMSTWWIAIIAALMLLVLGILVALRNDRGRLFIDTGLLRLPVFGSLIELIALERLNRVLGTLASAGVPLPDALTLGARVVGNRLFTKAILATRRGVMNGEGLAAPMAATGVFPEATVQVVLVGEKTGRLSEQLQQAARLHGQELDYRLKNFATLLEPVILLIVGGAVGFVAIALVSAMYGIYNSGVLAG